MCFPADANVQLLNESHMRMDKLLVGHQVRVEKNLHSAVFMFSHAERHKLTTFISVFTRCGQNETLTPGLLIYVDGGLYMARGVRPGHYIKLADGDWCRVHRTDVVVRRGIFNPHTIDGQLAMNGIVTSTYTTALHPMGAHTLLTPIRALSRVTCTNSIQDIVMSAWARNIFLSRMQRMTLFLNNWRRNRRL